MQLRHAGFAILVAAAVSPARADVEIGGFAGVHLFSHTNELGVRDAPDAPSQGNGFLGGARIGVYFTDIIGVELELGVIPTNARVENNHYGVTDITYRAHVIAQFGTADDDRKLVPFVLAGAGAFSVISSNNKAIAPDDFRDLIASSDTDPVFYAGFGAKYRMSERWGLRADARLLLPPSSSSSGVAVDFELFASAYAEFGRPNHRPPPPPQKIDPPPPPVDEDPDHDGIAGAADKCPNEAEDKDGYQDEDGCPDPDNDHDGVADKDDKCPGEAETKNGYQDEDGCPDEVPAPIKQFTGAIQGITFKLSSAELTPESSEILDKALAVLVEYKDVRLEIQGHADDLPLAKHKVFKDNLALSQARAEAVKAYFVGKGVDTSRLEAKGYGDTVPLEETKALKGKALLAARGKNRRVEFKLLAH